MRRTLLPVLMLLCLSSLFARPTLVVKAEEESPAYALMTGVASRVAEHSLLSRMDGEGELSVFLSDLMETGPNALSVTVVFSYGQRVLKLCVSAEAKDTTHLEKALEKRLSSMLLYDGAALFEAEDALLIDYTYTHGYSSLIPLHKGEYYKGVDREGNRWATVVVQRAFASDGPVSLLVGTSGKELLPGMKLEKMAGKSVSLYFSGALAPGAQFGLEGLYSQEVGLYPFTLVLGGGFDLAFSTLYAQAGFAVHLPLSMAFGLQSGFWRNSLVSMRCTLGLGYSITDADLLYGSSAVFSYRYHVDGVGLDVGVGNKHWASDLTTSSSGLFMQLGLAYTW